WVDGAVSADFVLASRAAAVAGIIVTIVTLLAWVGVSVTAGGIDGTGIGAIVGVVGVAIVALFVARWSGLGNAVAAAFILAGRAAAVAGYIVAVVALLTAVDRIVTADSHDSAGVAAIVAVVVADGVAIIAFFAQVVCAACPIVDGAVTAGGRNFTAGVAVGVDRIVAGFFGIARPVSTEGVEGASGAASAVETVLIGAAVGQ